MCGIAGFLDNGTSAEDLRPVVLEMAHAIQHRGPDDAGAWADPISGVALGHQRLSILDLSPEGHQPMLSSSGRFVITFNGEVYNFEELRQRLPGHPWRGRSDTEVMLAAIESWGLERAVREFVGMFAFAVWDRKEHELHLVRDRLGIKPLYYGWCGRSFVFGSELKALLAHPGFDAVIDRGAVALLMRYGYVPDPYSIYDGIRKLSPGTILRVRPDGKLSLPTPYWSAREIARCGVADPLPDDAEAAVEQLHDLLLQATRLRMIADVPLGAFLSGGVDSSAVVAAMQAQSTRPVKTFSIGFAEPEYDEAPHAREVARHLGTNHTELYVTPAEAQSVVPSLSHYFDEPFADSSQIPTLLVSRLARKHVTVALSGDGGDEIFGGYPRYLLADKIWRYIYRVPRIARRSIAGSLQFVSSDTWAALFQTIDKLLPAGVRSRRPGEQMHRLAAIASEESQQELYKNIISHWAPSAVVLHAEEPPALSMGMLDNVGLTDFRCKMMFFDLVTYLPSDILTKVDRASMAVGLEARIPLLDHRIVEFAWRLPISLRMRPGAGKWLLRQVLHKYVPDKLFDRAKMGFGVPVGKWLRGPLRGWAEAMLDPNRLLQQGFFNVDLVRRTWNQHVDGKRNSQYQLWDVLMFQSWIESQDSFHRTMCVPGPRPDSRERLPMSSTLTATR